MNGPSSAEAPEKGSRGSRLLLEIILSIVTVAAICFLPALHLFASNPNDLSLGELMGSVWLFAAIGLGLWIVLRLITRKRPYFAGCLTAIIVFFMVNFSLVTSLFRLFLHNYIAINLLSLVFVALVIVGCAFLFLRLCKTESVGRGILAVICVVFVGLLLFNGVTYFRNVKASGSSAKPTAAPTAVVEAPTPTPTPEPEEGSIVSQQTPEPAVGTPEATLEATPEETATPVVTEAPKTAENVGFAPGLRMSSPVSGLNLPMP